MNRFVFGFGFAICLCTTPALARSFTQSFKESVEPLIEASCIDCHDNETKTPLNFEKLSHDLANPKTFAQWIEVFDQLEQGTMPPKKKPRPNADQLKTALTSIKQHLLETNTKVQQQFGRVPTRRLTRLEYEYTLHDLLGIRTELAKHLPPENASSSFDTVAADQGLSLVHIRSYLNAADIALNAAIQLGPRPIVRSFDMNYQTARYSTRWVDRPLRRGGSTSILAKDAYVTFDDRPHVLRSDHVGFRAWHPGLYRISAEAYGYQAKTPVTFTLKKSSDKHGITQLVAVFDLEPGKSRTIETTVYLRPDDYFFPAPADHDWTPDGKNVYIAKGAKFYKGEGLAIKWLKVEGPLLKQWPPASTRNVLHGVTFKSRHRLSKWPGFDVELKSSPGDHLKTIVQHLGPLAFRRPLKTGEADGFLRLAEPAMKQAQPFGQVVRAPLRAMLSSPQFLFHTSAPGELNHYALATRLSYFLWKSMPDKELFELAANKTLRDPKVLAKQVDRMIDDPKSNRFIHDFLDQWLGLKNIDATTPDEKLYPEYDDILRQAMLQETRLFLRELIDKNLSTDNLIDSKFTFLNRRLAEHYRIPNVKREHFRRVALSKNSVRGGLLTQASILKVTANGTVTSPVKRGAFVLSKLLGTPPKPPPPDAGTIEPDTRGTTTVRETLDAHRKSVACANCHQHIDPPGFALESFDPIGGYRTQYRSTGKGQSPKRLLFGRRIWEYKVGLPVDASGVTPTGEAFDDIIAFKHLLLKNKQQVARHFISQLIVYATGGEIQFADRQTIEKIIQETSSQNYPVRTMIHKVVQSELFRNK